nr:MAG TPA: tail collar fiber protein [Caudoviricetes sp.]
MAEWSNAIMTDVGNALQAKVNAGQTKLTFTKIKVGSGVNVTNPLALTDVISSKWETTNIIVKREGKIVSVDTFITNSGITEAFRMSEIGVFAKDPDKGEILYAYITDPEPDRMPAEGGSVVVSQELSIGMMFSNTGNVSLTVNMGALVNQEQLNEHNSSISSHSPITDQIKAILGSTNWKDVPASTLVTIKNLLGQGAIVASKLDANAGFVKFANGFTIQWGRDNYDSDERSHWVTFPISFIECYSAVPSIIGGSSDSIKIYNINKTGFEKVSYYNFQTNKTVSRPCLWLAVGKA